MQFDIIEHFIMKTRVRKVFVKGLTPGESRVKIYHIPIPTASKAENPVISKSIGDLN